jgi:hypothetical protein
MSGFKTVEGEYVIISMGGVYKQVDLVERNGYLFAAASGGFVRLYADGSTSKAKMRLDEMSYEGTLCVDKLGRLCGDWVTGAKTLTAEARTKLLT